MEHLQSLTVQALIRRMERGLDFEYDDEAVELSRRGYKWQWDGNEYGPERVKLLNHCALCDKPHNRTDGANVHEECSADIPL